MLVPRSAQLTGTSKFAVHKLPSLVPFLPSALRFRVLPPSNESLWNRLPIFRIAYGFPLNAHFVVLVCLWRALPDEQTWACRVAPFWRGSISAPGPLPTSACIAACLQLAKADIRALSKGSVFDPLRTSPVQRSTSEGEVPVATTLGSERFGKSICPICYSITSSAVSRIDCGTVSPRALAVLRFRTISNLVGN